MSRDKYDVLHRGGVQKLTGRVKKRTQKLMTFTYMYFRNYM